RVYYRYRVAQCAASARHAVHWRGTGRGDKRHCHVPPPAVPSLVAAAKRSAVQRYFGWGRTSGSGWGRVAPQGCPGVQQGGYFVVISSVISSMRWSKASVQNEKLYEVPPIELELAVARVLKTQGIKAHEPIPEPKCAVIYDDPESRIPI